MRRIVWAGAVPRQTEEEPIADRTVRMLRRQVPAAVLAGFFLAGLSLTGRDFRLLFSLVYGAHMVISLFAGAVPAAPKLWLAPSGGQARHAARVVFCLGAAMLTSTPILAGLLLFSIHQLGGWQPWAAALSAWGAFMLGQAVGCLLLPVRARRPETVLLSLAVITALTAVLFF